VFGGTLVPLGGPVKSPARLAAAAQSVFQVAVGGERLQQQLGVGLDVGEAAQGEGQAEQLPADVLPAGLTAQGLFVGRDGLAAARGCEPVEGQAVLGQPAASLGTWVT